MTSTMDSANEIQTTNRRKERHQVSINVDEIRHVNHYVPHSEPHPLAVTEYLSIPFTFVAGNQHHHNKLHIFNKSSGILGVLSRQDQKVRLIGKTGHLHTHSHFERVKEREKFMKDIFITIIDFSWLWLALLFLSIFFASWLSFAAAWYVISFHNGDLEMTNQMANSSHIPCVTNFNGFGSAFLFSIEVQQTIGFGRRYPTENCPSGIILMCIQSILGVIIQAGMAGIVFAKFTMPKKRGQTIVFSKNAVITIRNGVLCLLFRITDLRKSSLQDAKIKMLLVHKQETWEGEVIPFQQTELNCGIQVMGGSQAISMFWPITICHPIDSTSPFYNLKPTDLLTSNFEIILFVFGVTEETANSVQARTSYLPNEILWGHRFDNDVVTFDRHFHVYDLDHKKLDETILDRTPRMSAKELDDGKESQTTPKTERKFR